MRMIMRMFSRYDITQDDMMYEAYRWPAAAPESSSDHAGEDVAVYATGPQSHLFRSHRFFFQSSMWIISFQGNLSTELHPPPSCLCRLYWRGGEVL